MAKWTAPVIIAFVVLIPVGLNLSRGDTREVQSVLTEPVSISPSILASGTLAYQSEVTLVPEIIGRVREVLVNEGDVVERGQMLLRLDPTASLAEIAQLEAARRQSQFNIQRQRVMLEAQNEKWQRFEKLRGEGLIDANTFQEMTSQRRLAEVELSTSLEMLKQSEAQLSQASERLAKTEFRAPISGTITSVPIKVGETAVPSAMSIAGSQLMTVADVDTLYAEVNVDEADIARVSVGLEASVVSAAYPDESWKGVVELIGVSPKQIAGQGKRYPVKVRLNGGDRKKFHPGMSCRVEVSTTSRDGGKVLGVPAQAVRYERDDSEKQAKTSVFVLKDEKVTQRPVEVGIADDANIQIRRGLDAGERVVTGPARTLRSLRDGDRVSTVASSAGL